MAKKLIVPPEVSADLASLWKYLEAQRNIVLKAHEDIEPSNMSHIGRGYLSQHANSLADAMDEVNGLIEKYNPNENNTKTQSQGS